MADKNGDIEKEMKKPFILPEGEYKGIPLNKLRASDLIPNDDPRINLDNFILVGGVPNGAILKDK